MGIPPQRFPFPRCRRRSVPGRSAPVGSAPFGFVQYALLLGFLLVIQMMPASAQFRAPQTHPDWLQLDHAVALAAFRRSCPAAGSRLDGPERQSFQALCRAAQALSSVSRHEARLFFERHFCLAPAVAGLATGYFEPEIEGRLQPEPGFDTPLLAPPAGLVSLAGRDRGGLPQDMSHALKTPEGLRPLPVRAEIEAGVLADRARPLVYLDRVEAFFAHIQGSVRVQLGDGRSLRLRYAGKNGHPYTAIGRLLVARGEMRLEEVSMDSLKAWLRAHPHAAGQLMQENRSYIFFSVDEAGEAALGPRGALEVQLAPMVSAAVDPAAHPLGLPLLVKGEAVFRGRPFAALMLAQDVGSAINGAGRIDIFTGSGAAGGELAGHLRAPVSVHQLLPRDMCGGGS